MSDNDLNNCPATGVQQHQTKIAFLIDCDGGLSAAFHPKHTTVIAPKLIKDFPSNSDIFLFYNSNDSNIVKRMRHLKIDNPNVHLFPNNIPNTKNGADMNLSFILGAISKEYKKYGAYVIIARHDRAYEEIKIRLENTDSRLKNHVELRRFDGPKELAQYVRELVRVQNEDPDELNELCGHNLSYTRSSITVKFTPENLFRHCPLESWQQSSLLYRFAELVDHLDHEHPETRYQYCSTCQKMVQEDDWSQNRCQLFDEHFQNEHLNNQAGFSLNI